MALNPKQTFFVKEYLIDQNATRAAKAAGYSPKTAYSQGHDLLKNPEVAAQIKKGLDMQKRNLEAKAARRGITKERWLAELGLIAFANMDDHAQVVKVKAYNGRSGKPVYYNAIQAVETKKKKNSSGHQIKKLSETKNGIGIELHSKQAALELIGKHFGWVKNEIELSSPNGGAQVIITLPSNGREAPKDKDKE